MLSWLPNLITISPILKRYQLSHKNYIRPSTRQSKPSHQDSDLPSYPDTSDNSQSDPLSNSKHAQMNPQIRLRSNLSSINSSLTFLPTKHILTKSTPKSPHIDSPIHIHSPYSPPKHTSEHKSNTNTITTIPRIIHNINHRSSINQPSSTSIFHHTLTALIKSDAAQPHDDHHADIPAIPDIKAKDDDSNTSVSKTILLTANLQKRR